MRIVAVGPGSERAAALAARAIGVGYPLLADPRTLLAKRFGFRRLLGLLQESGVAVIDRAGTVRMLHRTANPGAALHMEEVRRVLDALDPSGPSAGGAT